MRTLAAIAVAIIAVLAGLSVYLQPTIGDVVETWQTENDIFKIRVDSRAEVCHAPSFCLPGAYFVFLSSPRHTDRWREIMTFRHDDPVPIPRDNVRFVSDRLAYAFMGWMFAVTTDGGVNWSVWNAENDLPSWKCCHYRAIGDIHIETDGSGTMTLLAFPDDVEVWTLRTTDFGKHWTLERPSKAA